MKELLPAETAEVGNLIITKWHCDCLESRKLFLETGDLFIVEKGIISEKSVTAFEPHLTSRKDRQ